ncbi:MAG: hypothetical protein IT207_11425 [Fimbriimonadaceae bacterium]|nr:hypothetical protein [Fimbriimonadaceae bacterium]
MTRATPEGQPESYGPRDRRICACIAYFALAQTSATNSVAIGDGHLTLTIEFQPPFAQAPGAGIVRVSGTDANFDVSTLAQIHDPAPHTILDSKVWIGRETIAVPVGFDGGHVRYSQPISRTLQRASRSLSGK